jgi:hypothetical protein
VHEEVEMSARGAELHTVPASAPRPKRGAPVMWLNRILLERQRDALAAS